MIIKYFSHSCQRVSIVFVLTAHYQAEYLIFRKWPIASSSSFMHNPVSTRELLTLWSRDPLGGTFSKTVSANTNAWLLRIVAVKLHITRSKTVERF